MARTAIINPSNDANRIRFHVPIVTAIMIIVAAMSQNIFWCSAPPLKNKTTEQTQLIVAMKKPAIDPAATACAAARRSRIVRGKKNVMKSDFTYKSSKCS
jgi:hypothetical protein